MNLNDVYSEVILEHSQNKFNKKHLENPDVCKLGSNPNCGDEITLELKFDKDIIVDGSYTGQGCAISTSSASIMIDLIKGKTKAEALELANIFIGMIKKEVDEEKIEKLEDAQAFKNISNMPARVKCALLAWYTLKGILEEVANK